ncbi:MAG: thioredoxin domain-containing protein [Methanomicrobiaceae archaeon]|nr:thioredoxin domain-containing protein [Methanomicrobiaceae archaeon]
MANRLSGEKSPYLLQHAENPVNWYPWGEEAFSRAREEDKPVFLSIGYSTCHWCHVMAHESFEDEEVAGILNSHFIAVKVDREEHPDIDQVYMTVAHTITGRGGWPLTIIMTPGKKPFFAATYIPKQARFEIRGLLDLLPEIARLWERERERIEEAAGGIVSSLSAHLARSTAGSPGADLLDAGYRALSAIYDHEHGGFGSAPKFPSPHMLLFLLRVWHRTGDDRALEMVERTLTAMRSGGVYDQLGFGFHRYATDRKWSIPHFEKMLYDQALLAYTYLEAFQVTGRPLYRRCAEEVFAYVLGRMADPSGGFYSAEDADIGGEEGRYYTWTGDELRSVLGEDAERTIEVYHLRDAVVEGRGVLQLGLLDPGAAEAQVRELEPVRIRLLHARETRVLPARDEKILADWNGLFIAALAKGAQVLGSREYLSAAGRAADYLLNVHRREDGRLLHRSTEGGRAGIVARLDDYAFLIWGLVELYGAGYEARYLAAAQDLAEEMIRHHRDGTSEGFFLSPDDGEELILRPSVVHDGALPSGNSAAMLSLLLLSRLTGRTDFEEQAWEVARAFAREVERLPEGHAFYLSALESALAGGEEVVVAGERSLPETREMLSLLRSSFHPHMVVLLRSPEEEWLLDEVAPYTSAMGAGEGVPTAYLCSGGECRLPTQDTGELAKALGTKGV